MHAFISGMPYRFYFIQDLNPHLSGLQTSFIRKSFKDLSSDLGTNSSLIWIGNLINVFKS